MCIFSKILGMLYSMFISGHIVFKEKFGVFMPLHFDFVQGNRVNGNIKQECIL